MEVLNFTTGFHHHISVVRPCGRLHQLHRRPRRRQPPSTNLVVATRKNEENDDGGRLWESVVDDNMRILRKRADEYKVVEVAGEAKIGECEKKKYCIYQSELFEVLGLMHLDLEAKRPKVGVGISVMVTVTMPVSVIVLFLHIVDAAKLISRGFDDK